MNIDKIRFILEYFKLKSDLCTEYHYDNATAARMIRELRAMEPNVLRLFLEWRRTRDLPKDAINGVRITDIMEHRGMNPVAAFLALSWVQEDPGAAKSALVNTADTVKLTKKSEDTLRMIAQNRGWKLPDAPEEDTSDLVDPL